MPSPITVRRSSATLLFLMRGQEPLNTFPPPLNSTHGRRHLVSRLLLLLFIYLYLYVYTYKNYIYIFCVCVCVKVFLLFRDVRMFSHDIIVICSYRLCRRLAWLAKLPFCHSPRPIWWPPSELVILLLLFIFFCVCYVFFVSKDIACYIDLLVLLVVVYIFFDFMWCHHTAHLPLLVSLSLSRSNGEGRRQYNNYYNTPKKKLIICILYRETERKKKKQKGKSLYSFCLMAWDRSLWFVPVSAGIYIYYFSLCVRRGWLHSAFVTILYCLFFSYYIGKHFFITFSHLFFSFLQWKRTKLWFKIF